MTATNEKITQMTKQLIRVRSYFLLESTFGIIIGLAGMTVVLLLNGGIWASGGSDAIKNFLYIGGATPIAFLLLMLLVKFTRVLGGRHYSKDSVEPIPAPSDYEMASNRSVLLGDPKRAAGYLILLTFSIPLVGALVPGMTVGFAVLGLLAYIRTIIQERSRGIVLMREPDKHLPEYYIQVEEGGSQVNTSTSELPPQEH